MKKNKALFSNSIKFMCSYGIIPLTIMLLFNSCDQEVLETTTLEVETIEADFITTTSAQVSGVIQGTGNGIKDYGHCWSIYEMPTIEENTVTNHSPTLDTFSTTFENLNHNTTYYVRAYANDGSQCAYGEVISFTTKEITFDIIKPSSGEEIDDETNYEIKWETIGSVLKVNIYYEEDAGSNEWTVISTNYNNSGSYIWFVPAIADGYYWQQCRIKIEDSNDTDIFKISSSFMLRKL